MKKHYKTIIIIAAVAVLVWRLYMAIFGPGSALTDRGGAAVAVEVTPVRKMSIDDIGMFTGSLLPRTQFIVAPKIAGRLEKIRVQILDLLYLQQVQA